jgi:hypothetical protein
MAAYVDSRYLDNGYSQSIRWFVVANLVPRRNSNIIWIPNSTQFTVDAYGHRGNSSLLSNPPVEDIPPFTDHSLKREKDRFCEILFEAWESRIFESE